jgi:hypothetical protein
MRRDARPDFEGLPLTGLRGLPAAFFTHEVYNDTPPIYYREDDSSIVPEELPRTTHQTEALYEALSGPELRYTSETTDLGNKDLPVYPYGMK